MHGKNKVRPLEGGDGLRLQVAEIFYTIQGEGPFYGMPAVFVRLTGCNLRCWFCDTKWDDEHDRYWSVDEIVNEVKRLGGNTDLVVMTGGEPLRQNLEPLFHRLYTYGFKVQVETAGTYWQDCLTMDHVTIVCSPKTKHVHKSITQFCDDWKYVIAVGQVNEHDGLPSGCTQEENPFVTLESGRAGLAAYVPRLQRYGDPARPPSNRPVTTIWLSPCDEGDPVKNQQNKLLVARLCLEHGYRAQVQMHKELGLP